MGESDYVNGYEFLQKNLECQKRLQKGKGKRVKIWGLQNWRFGGLEKFASSEVYT